MQQQERQREEELEKASWMLRMEMGKLGVGWKWVRWVRGVLAPGSHWTWRQAAKDKG